jgi:streptogramin lyase
MERRIPKLGILLVLLAAPLVTRIAQMHATPSSAAAGPRLEKLDSWGVKGGAPGQLESPVSITSDSIGNVYIADAGSGFIHKFDSHGTPLLSFQEDALRHPESIAVDPYGVIYVSDPLRSSVFVFFKDGEHHRELRLRTRPSKENEVSVAVGEDGLIHILDANSGMIFTYTDRFRLEGSWEFSAPPSGRTGFPGPVREGPDGSLYIADPAHNRIARFTRSGQFMNEIGYRENSQGQRMSTQFAVSLDGVFAMDSDGRMLHVFTPEGVPKFEVDLAPELGQAARPAPALTVNPRQDLFVLDTLETRVFRYHINF